MPSPAVSHKRVDMAYLELKRRLLTGELTAGARVDVNAIVVELDASRQPVLAAISRLAAEGFLRVVPQVGCWVATVGEQEVADFFRLFALTEGLSCELAAIRRTRVGVAVLRGLLEETDELLKRESDPKRLARAFFRLNRQFHGQIHEMAGSTYVGGVAAGMWDRCDFYMASGDPGIQGERVVESEREHLSLVNAIESGDANAAKRMMVEHIDSFGQIAVAHLRDSRQLKVVNG